MKVICIGRAGGAGGVENDMRALRLFGIECGIVSTSSADNVEFQMEDALGGPFADRAVIALRSAGNGGAVDALVKVLSLRDDLIVYEPSPDAANGVRAIKGQLLRHVALLALDGRTVPLFSDTPPENPEHAAKDILRHGVRSVVIRGADGKNYWSDGNTGYWIRGAKTPPEGPLFSCGVCAGLAAGLDIQDSLILAMAREMRFSRIAKAEKAPITAPVATADLPASSFTQNVSWTFPSIETAGTRFYPIVSRADRLKRLAPLGVTMAQLRIKDLHGDALETEIRTAIAFAREQGCRLFINDYWELAIQLGAYGVHLGQEDLATARLDDIAGAGLRLGVSTHSFFEASVAHGLRPSYVAFGPVFFTTLKAMRFAPQGVERLKLFKEMLPYPMVAIGGITLENAAEVLKATPEFISVVGDIANAPDPESRTRQWLDLLA